MKLEIKLIKNLDTLIIEPDKYLNFYADAISSTIKKKRVTPYRTGQLQRTSFTNNNSKGAFIKWPVNYAQYVWDMETRLKKPINWTIKYNPNAREKWSIPILSDYDLMQRLSNSVLKHLKIRAVK